MSVNELACSYAALILHDDGVPVTAEKMEKLLAAANLETEPIWTTIFAKALEGQNIGDLLMNVGSGAPGPAVAAVAAPAAGGKAEEKKAAKVEEKEESDEDMGFGLFD